MGFRDLFERREPEKPESIHPAFQILDKVDEGRYWRWNFTDFSQYLTSRGLPPSYKQTDLIKVAFAFDDPNQLDECPYMCKIGENLAGDTKYFGIAFELRERMQDLNSWAAKFSRHELLDLQSRQL